MKVWLNDTGPGSKGRIRTWFKKALTNLYIADTQLTGGVVVLPDLVATDVVFSNVQVSADLDPLPGVTVR